MKGITNPFEVFAMRMFVCLFGLFLLPAFLTGEVIHPGDCQAFAVEGEWLYLKPTVGDTGFIRINQGSVDLANSRRIANDMEYASGFRVQGIYSACDCYNELYLRYTRLHAEHSKSVSADGATRSISSVFALPFPSLFVFNETSVFAESKICLKYDSGDVYLERLLFNFCDFDFYFLAGVQYTYITYKEK